jgi:hypothetical protein
MAFLYRISTPTASRTQVQHFTSTWMVYTLALLLTSLVVPAFVSLFVRPFFSVFLFCFAIFVFSLFFLVLLKQVLHFNVDGVFIGSSVRVPYFNFLIFLTSICLSPNSLFSPSFLLIKIEVVGNFPSFY